MCIGMADGVGGSEGVVTVLRFGVSEKKKKNMFEDPAGVGY